MAVEFALLLFFLIVLLLTLLASRRQGAPALRAITAFEALPDQIGRAAESGQTLHLSLGTGGVGGGDTVTALAGLSVLAHLAEQGVAADTPPLVTVSDPTLLPVAQNVLRRAYAQLGRGGDFRWSQVRVISPTPMAYALGTMDILNHEPVLANIMLGAFGPEVALVAHAGAEAGLVQISGSDDPVSIAVLQASTERVIVGEELYATETYLNRTPIKLAALAAQDVVRVMLILFVIVLAILKLLGAL